MPRKVILSQWDWVTSRDGVGLEQFWDPVLTRQETFRGVICASALSGSEEEPRGHSGLLSLALCFPEV